MNTTHPVTAAYAAQKVTGQDAALAKSAATITPFGSPVVLSPAMQMAALAAHRGLRWYEGTVPAATVERRRKANRASRRARRVHRK